MLLKAAAAGILPTDIIHRRKQGFTPPIGAWLRGSLRGYMEENLLDPAALSGEWLEPRVVGALAGRFLAGEERFALPLWVLLCLEVWLRSGSRVEATAR